MLRFIYSTIIVVTLITSQFLVATELTRLAPDLQKQKSLRQQKDAGAEVLYAIKKTHVQLDFKTESVQYYSIRINDADAARDFGRITLRYNHYYSDIELQFANVLAPDGELKTLSSDAMQKRIGGSQDFYDESSQLVFSLPDVSPGSIIEFQFITKQVRHSIPDYFSDASGNNWFQPTAGGRSGRLDYVHKAVYELTLDKLAPLEVELLGGHKIRYKKLLDNNTVTHRWTWKKLPEVPIESFMPWYESVASKVRVSSTRDWAVVDRWMWGLVEDKLQTNLEIQSIAENLVDRAATEQEKIKAVYAYLQNNFRYVYAHLGRGGYEPHFAAEVVNRLYGDCKDQTILAVALLNALDVKALPALVVTPRADRPSMSLVAMYFDHMIVWIPGEEDSGIWMDTTGDRSLYPGLSNALLDQPAFIIDGKGGRGTAIGRVEYPSHATMNLDYSLNESSHLVVNMSVIFSGSLEQDIRNWWVHLDDRETALYSFAKAPFAGLSSEATIKAALNNVNNLWRPVSLTATIDFGPAINDAEKSYSIGANIAQVLGMFGELNGLSLPETRQGPWVSRQDITLQLNVTMNSSDRFASSLMRSALDEINPYFEVRQIAKRMDNGFILSMDYRRSKFQLHSNDYAQFYKLSKDLMSGDGWKITFYLPIAITRTNSFGGDARQEGDETAAYHIARARVLIDLAQFEESEAASREAIDIDKENGEAWYVLGVAMGFQANLASAESAFARAKNLGFQP